MKDQKRVTARDVAALASVSPGTVSKAFSRNGPVHPDTRARIFDAARELGFRGVPDDVPEIAGRTRTVGLVTRDPFDRRTAPMLLGLLERLTEHDIAFLVCDGRGDPIREQYFIDSLQRRQVDGYIVSGSEPGTFSRRSLATHVDAPVVYAMTTSTNDSDISVVPDNRGGVELAARHVLQTGRRRVVCVLGPAHEDAAHQKESVTRAILQANGLDLVAPPLCGQWDEEWGRQAARQLVHDEVHFDAVICGNDVLARGVCSTLQGLGMSVPGDVAIVGFDNWGLMVEANRPRLTSVDLRLPEVGRVAAQKLIDAIEGRPPAPGTTYIESRLVARESTALPTGAGREVVRRLLDARD